MSSPQVPAAFTPERPAIPRHRFPGTELLVLLIAALVFLGCILSPPSLMDDVDAVQAQISRTMIETGDWVTPHLNGVKYMEKPPLKYWIIALSFLLFGVRDWAARLPLALSAVALCWLVARIGRWAFGDREGLFAGLVISTSLGLWLFTRILIADVMVTLTVALAMWAFFRSLEPDEPHPRRWSAVFGASMGIGFLLKGLIAMVFPCGAAFLYLLATKRLLRRDTWQRLRPFTGAALAVLIALPWVIAATLQNPPYFDWTTKSEPGQYHGWFWFFFLNEHVFRFLNLRYPRDYNTVPRLQFWLYHLLWFFPWAVYLPLIAKLGFGTQDRASRMRLLALCWIGFILLFFSFSTTQEYYSMPAYPAIALLIGSAMAAGSKWLRPAARVAGVIAGAALAAILFILTQVWNLPTPGDISRALVTQSTEVYTLALGHMGDLTLASFAYLRPPLILAGIAFLIGFAGTMWRRIPVHWALAAMVVLFVHAARLALITFDPYLSSRALAEAYRQSPPGTLVVDNQYYAFSSVFFYANTRALLLNGRVTNLQYGSYAPGAPQVFLEYPGFAALWQRPERAYLLVEKPSVPRIEALIGRSALHLVEESGGKFLYTNDATLR